MLGAFTGTEKRDGSGEKEGGRELEGKGGRLRKWVRRRREEKDGTGRGREEGGKGKEGKESSRHHFGL